MRTDFGPNSEPATTARHRHQLRPDEPMRTTGARQAVEAAGLLDAFLAGPTFGDVGSYVLHVPSAFRALQGGRIASTAGGKTCRRE